MTCSICGRDRVWHGSEHQPAPGTYLSEMGCHDGVRMDDDEYGEGWQEDVVYPPCAFNPSRCPTCDGSSYAPPLMREAMNRDDCADCNGTGWKEGKCQWPTTAEYDEDSCPGHVASASDPKVCGRCGVHIDSLRPDDGDF